MTSPSSWHSNQFSSLALAALFLLPCARAVGNVVVSVIDDKNQPVSGAVVLYSPSVGAQAAAPGVFEIVQEGQMFVPELIIIPAGSRVRFPNRDRIAHHVYSFSEAKKFDIPLYSGEVPDEILFDRAGIVTIGCNIHDWMIAHIVVSDTPHAAKTGEDGSAVLRDLPPGSGSISVWHPRIRGEPVRLEISPGQPIPAIGLKLRPEFRRRQAPVAGDDAGGYR